MRNLEFNGVTDIVKLYCPRCDGNTMQPMSENRYRCQNCEIEMEISSFGTVWNKPLSEEEIRRLYIRHVKTLKYIRC